MTFKFFFLNCAIPDNHVLVCTALAQGLRGLGHKVVANTTMWNESLFPPCDGTGWDFEILDYRYAYHVPTWSFEFRHNNTKPKILVDQMPAMNLTSPWLFHNWINRVDLILTTHGVIPRKKQFERKVVRWGLGLIDEVMGQIDETRTGEVVPSIDPWKSWRNEHSARRMVSEIFERDGVAHRIKTKIVEDDTPPLVCTEGLSRFNKRYFEYMNRQRLTLAFCGHLESRPVKIGWKATSNSPSAFRLKDRIEKAIWKRMRRNAISGNTHSILQWDSYRFWESLYSDSIPITFDFEYWGINTEVQPKAFEHYVPFRNCGKALFESIEGMDEEKLLLISKQGQEFFLKHHSPIAKAKRLLQCLNEL
tara:strand:- start:4757 stop:5845 length:1089 start_codon:yes stop_codon:yes gene_type:complete